MKPTSPIQKTLPIDIVGSTVFGRYPKISIEQTYNMIISDGFLVPAAGYKKVSAISTSGAGRGIYASTRFNHIVAVISNGVYIINTDMSYARVAEIDTFNGDVFIDENNAGEIGICDKKNIYIFNYRNNTFQKANLEAGFIPGYICFQNTYFIAPNLADGTWRLSDNNNGLSWPADAAHIGEFQTKPDMPVGAVRFPGKGNLLLVFGSTVTEPWYDLGYQLFPYQKNTFENFDFGCLNPATIASNDDIVVWLGANEKSGPVIMMSNGGEPQQISTDGINFKFANLTNPSNSYGFLFKQDGHSIYQITFPDDNLTYIYDFETNKFFTLCDQYMNAHIAKRVVFFNNSYYFVSFVDGNLYEMNSKYTTYDGAEIPRIRVCKNIRLPDSSLFVVSNITYLIEQGNAKNIQRIDLSVSSDGGESFSNTEGKDLNEFAQRQNRLDWWQCGSYNDLVPQFRFWSQDRFVIGNGQLSIEQ
jgi:hypothetical protein